MSRIFITSDTHGLLDINKIKRISESKILTYDDYLIICGDVGIGWDENLTKELIKFYESLNTNILFIDGNHENFNQLKRFKIETWNGGCSHKISEHIRFLERGQVFNICGKLFLTLGGADSHDKEFRTEGESWWRDEAISNIDIAIALENVAKHNFKVDYILTHTPNQFFAYLIYEKFTQCAEDFPAFLQVKLINNESGEKLNTILKRVKFKKWFCGHWHIDEIIDDYVMLYENVYEI